MKSVPNKPAYRNGNYEIGKYLHTGGGRATCVFCYCTLDDGHDYMQITSSWRYTPYVHKECLKEAVGILDEKDLELERSYKRHLKQREKAKSEHAQKMAEKKSTKEWRKHLIKESLKKAGILVSKVSITFPNDWGLHGKSQVIKVAEKSKNHWGKSAFFFIVLEKSNVRIIHPVDVHGYHSSNLSMYDDLEKLYPKQTSVPLEDPEALEKIAEAVLEHVKGNISPYMKKKKK